MGYGLLTRFLKFVLYIALFRLSRRLEGARDTVVLLTIRVNILYEFRYRYDDDHKASVTIVMLVLMMMEVKFIALYLYERSV